MKKISIIAILIAISIHAFGQDEQIEQKNKQVKIPDFISVGVGALVSTGRIYDGVGSEVIPIPLIQAKYGRFNMYGLEPAYNIFVSKQDFIAVVATGNYNGYDEGDSDALRGMSDRKMSIDTGIRYTHYFTRSISAEAKIKHDILGRHDGFTGDIKAKYTHNFPNLFISPYIGIEYLSAKTSTYYFGVEDSEATTTRPSYSLSDTFNPKIGVSASYDITKKIAAGIQLETKFYDSKITSSPIVDRNYEISFLTGITYRFNLD